MDDAELVRRCVAGEPAAWDLIVARHVALLHAVVGRVLVPGARAGHEAEIEDVLQTVYLRLWEDGCRRLRTFEGRSRLSTWLAVLARREALDRVRTAAFARSKNRQDAARVGGSCTEQKSPDLVAEREARDRLLADVEALPPRDRLLLRLVSIDGLSYRDAAQLLDVPENSISPWLSRARDRLTAARARGNGRAYGSGGGAPLTGRSETP